MREANQFVSRSSLPETGAAGAVSCVADLALILSVLLPQNSGNGSGCPPGCGTEMVLILLVRRYCLLIALQRSQNPSIPSNDHTMFVPINLQDDHLDPAGSFGLGCAVQGVDRKLKNKRLGRRKGSAYWYGAANTEFWVDGVAGIVVIISGNFFPFADEAWADFIAKVEGLVYEGLEW